MERLRGPINSFLFGEGIESECLETGAISAGSAFDASYADLFPRQRHEMPFLQMFRGAMQAEEEDQHHLHLRGQQQALFTPYPPESNLQLLLRLQERHRGQKNWTAEVESSRAAEQHESCITHASESQSDARGADHPLHSHGDEAALGPASVAVTKERKRRKRPRAAAAAASSKRAEEVESQRMTHIAVERNRRRLMNEHLTALRSLMPPSFIQRGDQASIIGGAIEFVKELEQHFLSLHAEKRMRIASAGGTSSSASSPCTTLSRSNEEGACHVSVATNDSLHTGFFVAPQYTTYSRSQQQRRADTSKEEVGDEEAAAEGVDVEATVVQGHVNLKVAGRPRAGQLVRAIAAMEELRLSVLHLNITSLDPASILYSLNLKMEEECKLASADEIATAVHQIFGYINAC